MNNHFSIFPDHIRKKRDTSHTTAIGFSIFLSPRTERERKAIWVLTEIGPYDALESCCDMDPICGYKETSLANTLESAGLNDCFIFFWKRMNSESSQDISACLSVSLRVLHLSRFACQVTNTSQAFCKPHTPVA